MRCLYEIKQVRKREGEIEGNCVKVIRASGTHQRNGPKPQRNYTTISQLDTHTHSDTSGTGVRVRVSYIGL